MSYLTKQVDPSFLIIDNSKSLLSQVASTIKSGLEGFAAYESSKQEFKLYYLMIKPGEEDQYHGIETSDPNQICQLINSLVTPHTVLVFNANLRLSIRDNRQCQRGAELLMWLRLSGCDNHCIFTFLRTVAAYASKRTYSFIIMF